MQKSEQCVRLFVRCKTLLAVMAFVCMICVGCGIMYGGGYLIVYIYNIDFRTYYDCNVTGPGRCNTDRSPSNYDAVYPAYTSRGDCKLIYRTFTEDFNWISCQECIDSNHLTKAICYYGDDGLCYDEGYISAWETIGRGVENFFKKAGLILLASPIVCVGLGIFGGSCWAYSALDTIGYVVPSVDNGEEYGPIGDHSPIVDIDPDGLVN